MSMDRVIEALPGREQKAIERLVEWLRIPSVSTDPAYRDDTRRAAEWCRDELIAAGFEAELRETGTPDAPGHPMVWATNEGEAGYEGPHVLFYGHYDVQPPDPLELWESAPFEPVIKPADTANGRKPEDVPGERVVARGAVDDKGQVATFLEAVRAWKDEAGGVPIKITCMIEGEEESGSANLEQYMRAHKDELSKCDVCVVSDTGMLGRGKPAITYGLRGLAYTEVVLHGPDQDLHSGQWGGRVPNPINELSKVLAELWDSDRRVTIPGFYDDVLEPTPAEREAWSKLGFDQHAALAKVGVGPDGDIGEAGWTGLEREWARPTCDINGIWGGYTGAGAKTVIPAMASAKISFRLVANQDPDTIRDAFFAWLGQRTPPGCRWEMIDHSGGHPGNVPTDSPHLKAAVTALRDAGGVEPALIKTGGSIPVVGMLKATLDLDTLLIGFGLDDDRVHSPNEKFELECYRLGVRTHARLIGTFAGS
ncbi:MAG: M20/M25/M40 family metallo-hydrolase [Planctomycetota bacterium]